jgi:hypothetical protein
MKTKPLKFYVCTSTPADDATELVKWFPVALTQLKNAIRDLRQTLKMDWGKYLYLISMYVAWCTVIGDDSSFEINTTTIILIAAMFYNKKRT